MDFFPLTIHNYELKSNQNFLYNKVIKVLRRKSILLIIIIRRVDIIE